MLFLISAIKSSLLGAWDCLDEVCPVGPGGGGANNVGGGGGGGGSKFKGGGGGGGGSKFEDYELK